MSTMHAFDLPKPDITAERVGNTGTEGVWHFDSGAAGRHVMVCALVHGDEICGAWALKALLAEGVRPRRGKLTLVFCNLAAFDRFNPQSNPSSRFVDEDMNRIWSADKLAKNDTQERRRANALLPWVQQADWLLDLHSMSASAEPLQLTGIERRNIDLALSLGRPAYIIADAGHAAGVRMRDYGRFGESGDNGTRSLLIECGLHGAVQSRAVAIDQTARFLAACGAVDRADLPAAWFLPDIPRQRVLRVTQAVAARSTDFRFAQAWKGLESLPAGAVIGWSDGEPVTAPYDDCVLIMPSSLANLRPGVTVVRLAQTLA